LLLAKLMARPSNLLILDEPTNDLDVETLDLLQDILGEFDGTVLLVSHDRDFIDRDCHNDRGAGGGGRATVYPGGWSDYAAQRPASVPAMAEAGRPSPRREEPARAERARAAGLTFSEKRRLDELPGQIDRLTAEIAKLAEFLAQPELFTREP
jgi:ATP-binding cassette subfamily F protein uup